MSLAAETISDGNCGSCSSNCTSSAQLTKGGVALGAYDYLIALAGNPNTGKSTIFNQLTGLRQHVGNWAGKTVTRAEGAFAFRNKKYRLVDLPGTYSLLSTSADEEIARDFVLFGKPDVTVVVADAARLERNLGLVLQILEITDRAVVALNLIDEARRNGLEVNERALAKDLGVPVVPMAARRGEGISELLETIESVATGELVTKPHRIEYADADLNTAINSLAEKLEAEFKNLPNARWAALRLLEGDESIERAVRDKTLGNLQSKRAFPQLIQLEVK